MNDPLEIMIYFMIQSPAPNFMICFMINTGPDAHHSCLAGPLIGLQVEELVSLTLWNYVTFYVTKPSPKFYDTFYDRYWPWCIAAWLGCMMHFMIHTGPDAHHICWAGPLIGLQVGKLVSSTSWDYNTFYDTEPCPKFYDTFYDRYWPWCPP